MYLKKESVLVKERKRAKARKRRDKVREKKRQGEQWKGR